MPGAQRIVPISTLPLISRSVLLAAGARASWPELFTPQRQVTALVHFGLR
jgi:hypothetical protein